jgi:hypothetical protein
VKILQNLKLPKRIDYGKIDEEFQLCKGSSEKVIQILKKKVERLGLNFKIFWKLDIKKQSNSAWGYSPLGNAVETIANAVKHL